MVDPNAQELAAFAFAGERAGEFIESIGQTDMAQWTQEQWGQFIHVTCGGYVDALMAAQTDVKSAVCKIQPSDVPY